MKGEPFDAGVKRYRVCIGLTLTPCLSLKRELSSHIAQLLFSLCCSTFAVVLLQVPTTAAVIDGRAALGTPLRRRGLCH